MTKWKLVPVEPTPEMLDAGHRAAWQSVPSLFDRDDVANVYRAMLAAAPQPPKLSDDRILELMGFRAEGVVFGELKAKHAIDLARAIEREILRRLGMTEAIDAAIAAKKGGA